MTAMGLADTIQTDLVAAMKAGDDVKKTTLRAVLTAVKTAEAAEIYVGAGETARYQNEVDEREVLQAYLPEPLSPEELDELVASVIANGGYTSKKDMGKAIKEVMAKAAGRADGRAVSAAIGQALS